ncbi:hypothetical protein EYF80_035501 [Liparis tanakae]|uniref:Uncharacterized protein n=1 Tax=Liparis tanakae TaxID=230148 RepID=A0A4Z2GN95_9TELE|nr:hypothetical protein EYF80_035501 [Liparis tanakae]
MKALCSWQSASCPQKNWEATAVGVEVDSVILKPALPPRRLHPPLCWQRRGKGGGSFINGRVSVSCDGRGCPPDRPERSAHRCLCSGSSGVLSGLGWAHRPAARCLSSSALPPPEAFTIRPLRGGGSARAVPCSGSRYR